MEQEFSKETIAQEQNTGFGQILISGRSLIFFGTEGKELQIDRVYVF